MSTRHPLDGARLKVIRAQEHLDALNDQIGRYLDSRPHEVRVKKVQDDRARAELTGVRRDPPEELCLPLGDCVGNLRASLDYIAWELATRHHKRPPVVGEDRSISFPIFDDPNGDGPKSLAKMAKKWSFPAKAVAEIERVQPYHAGYKPLRTLRTLANADKHCLLLMTVSHPYGIAVTTPDGLYAWSNVGVFSVDLRAGGPRPPGEQAGQVDVEAQASVFVAFRDPAMPQGGVDLILGQIVECVSDVIRRFEPFFV